MTHHRFKELEEACKRIEKKRLRKSVLLSLSLVLAILLGAYSLGWIDAKKAEPSVVYEIEHNVSRVETSPIAVEENRFDANATDEIQSEEGMLEAFFKASTFERAYRIAEFYFDKNEYEQAILWSQKASELKPTSELPWALYARAKFRLGEKARAIEALETFLAYAYHKELDELLQFYKGQK